MKTAIIASAVIIGILVVATSFHWTINRVYVDEGKSLLLRYKGPIIQGIIGTQKKAKTGNWAAEGELGILKKLRGPGRHFYCPIWWERKIVRDVVIEPGQVGIVKCSLGDILPDGQYLVDGDIGETK